MKQLLNTNFEFASIGKSSHAVVKILITIVFSIGIVENVIGQEMTYEEVISNNKNETIIDSQRFNYDQGKWGVVRLWRKNVDPNYILKVQYLERIMPGKYEIKQEIDSYNDVAHGLGHVEMNDFNEDGIVDLYVLTQPMDGEPAKGIYYWGSMDGDSLMFEKQEVN